MRIFLITILSVIGFVNLAFAQSYLIHNAQIYTVNEDQPWAEAMAIKDGKIIDIGTNELVINAAINAAPNLRLIDAKGRFIMPGFHDVHLHALEAGITENICLMPEYDTLDNYAYLAAECAKYSDGDWVIGIGVYVAELLTQSENPLAVLDRAIPDRPALIMDNLGHGAWANSKALALVGYDTMQGDPDGGILHRDEDGNLTGVVFENAQQPLRNLAFAPNAKNKQLAYNSLGQALKVLAKNGITSISDAGGYWPQGHDDIWYEFEKMGKMTVRASNALYVFPNMQIGPQLEILSDKFQNDSNKLIRFNQAKLYVDGILSLGTGAVKKPYIKFANPHNPTPRGFEYFNIALFNQYVQKLQDIGYQMHFHTTGDRAAKIALDAVEKAANGTEYRHRITHAYLIDKSDIPRFKELGVIADFQANPDAVSHGYHRFIQKYIGDRHQRISPMKSMYESGATVTLSSDWDAGPLNPLGTIKRALTRPYEAVPDIKAAIEMATINGAILLHQENITGSLEAGKAADFIILDRNITEIDYSKIDQARVLATFLNGTATFDRLRLTE